VWVIVRCSLMLAAAGPALDALPGLVQLVPANAAGLAGQLQYHCGTSLAHQQHCSTSVSKCSVQLIPPCCPQAGPPPARDT
jgi:hypothetical protein